MNFVRSIIGCAAALALATSADAQSIGIKLGTSLSTFRIEPDREVDRLSSLSGGAFVRLGSGRLALQPEVLFVRKGAEARNEEGESFETRIKYLELPLLLHFVLMDRRSYAPYVFGGPAFAVDLGCSITGADGNADCDEGDLFPRRSTDVGVSVGGGLALGFGPGAFLLEARHTWGLLDINRTPDGAELRNRSVLVLAGYAVLLGF